MRRKGFTLIELMIVIAIIGILAAMAVPNFQSARAKARKNACYSNLRVIQSAVEMYNMDQVPMMTSLSLPQLESGKYLKGKAPTCPENPDLSYSYVGDLTETGVICCGSDLKGSGKLHGSIDGPSQN